MFRQLVTTAPGLDASDLAPLREYVEALGDGDELSPRLVNFIDAQAEKRARQVLSSLTQSLTAGVFVGILATVAGIFSAFVLSAQNAGAALFTAFVGGGAVAVTILRGVYYASRAGGASWVQSWSWAGSLGQRSDWQLARSRTLQAELARATSGHAWPIPAFTARARTRAQLLVGLMWALIGLGAVLVAIGFIGAFDNWGQSQLPTTTSP
jgi:hypothetical protein